VHETPEESWDQIMAVNGKGVWLGCKYAAGQMLRQDPHPSGDRGWIINLCSILGLVGVPCASIYCATKGAVLQMTKAIALEYAKDRIHVNCINPGFSETNMLEPVMASRGSEATHEWLEGIHPWGRLGMPEDIAKAAVFLASDGASWITVSDIFFTWLRFADAFSGACFGG
jgi:NAD(P)-dependent dehydrogenase (short-subunit alcohol dehydrogenase family)